MSIISGSADNIGHVFFYHTNFLVYSKLFNIQKGHLNANKVFVKLIEYILADLTFNITLKINLDGLNSK